MKTFRLGLIGANIRESRSPALQVTCGLSVGLNVSYDLLIPAEHKLNFPQMLAHCQAAGFDGVNVTYPFKEDVLKTVDVGQKTVAEIGASNTVQFLPASFNAWNTDFTGFMAAYRAKWDQSKPGRVLIIGTGGVGRAIAFALKELGATAILLHDVDPAKARLLARAVGGSVADPEQLFDLQGLDGVINCTPLGMAGGMAGGLAGRSGSALPAAAHGRLSWAFDAVYTPERTPFRAQVEAMGAAFLSGYELYFHQGIQAFEIFTGTTPDQEWVRKTLLHKA